MSKKVFDILRRGLEEAIADARGDKSGIRQRTVCVPTQLDLPFPVTAVDQKAPDDLS
jgi:hypothetical protein